jgi:hypothetical protein
MPRFRRLRFSNFADIFLNIFLFQTLHLHFAKICKFHSRFANLPYVFAGRFVHRILSDSRIFSRQDKNARGAKTCSPLAHPLLFVAIDESA